MTTFGDNFLLPLERIKQDGNRRRQDVRRGDDRTCLESSLYHSALYCYSGWMTPDWGKRHLQLILMNQLKIYARTCCLEMQKSASFFTKLIFAIHLNGNTADVIIGALSWFTTNRFSRLRLENVLKRHERSRRRPSRVIILRGLVTRSNTLLRRCHLIFYSRRRIDRCGSNVSGEQSLSLISVFSMTPLFLCSIDHTSTSSSRASVITACWG